MVNRILQVGIVSFVLVAGFGATCQNVDHSLPDAPSVPSAAPSQKPDAFFAEGRSPLEPGATVGVNLMRADAFAATPAESDEKQSKTIFDKYLARGSSKLSYHPSSSGLMGRATYAASRVLVTRDDSGKGRLNTSYLLRALASAAADTASHPYWRRSIGQPFSDFGSTVGNDAGMNLWHEFRPGIEQIMKSHTPRFVSRIEARVGHN
jgi:hypothetical protein